MNFFSRRLDKFFCKRLFKRDLGYSLNFSNVRTFNEKIQWLKVNQYYPVLTELSDKYLMRDYVKEKIGEEYLNEIYGVYSNLESLKNDIKKFPDKFVLKMNHASGWNIIVKNKNEFGKKEEKQLKKWLKINYYSHSGRGFLRYKGEWNYKNIKPLIICEKYLEDSNGELLDYKFFCFNGAPKYIQINVKDGSNFLIAFYDLEWNKQVFTYAYPLYKGEISKPKLLEEMINISRILSENFPFLRVDLYNIDDKHVYVGELTFYPGSGTNMFNPIEWDLKLGEMINLDK